jgi:putative flippase GtrA
MIGPERVPDRVGALVSGMRIGKFVSVGVVGTAADTTVLLVLSQAFGVVAEVATLAGIETAILVMFALNERWTFASQGAAGRGSLARRLGRSHLVRAAGSTTQFLVFVGIYRLLFVPLTVGDVAPLLAAARTLGVGTAAVAGVDLWILVAKIGGITVGMSVNYVFESLFTWRVHRQ